MRAVVMTTPGQLEVQDVDIAPRPGEVLLRTADCGICGTDLHLLRFPDAFRAGPGTVMGHEYSGEIVEVTAGIPAPRLHSGQSTAQGWRPGDRVVAVPMIACGDCDQCRAGFDWRCGRGSPVGLTADGATGAFAEYVRATPHTLFPIPDALSYRHAALTEPLAVGLHSVNRVRLDAGEPCLIMGAGPVGLFTLIWAKLRGAEPIVVSDPSPGRRDQAAALGAHAVVDPTDEDPAARMREITKGRWPAVVFDCVGTPPTLQEAMRLAARNGRVAVTGVCLQPYELQPMTAHAKELDVHYVFAYTHAEFQQALDALARGDVPADALISDVISLDDVPAMFQTLANPTTQLKVLVEPGARPAAARPADAPLHGGQQQKHVGEQ